jgi:hypothetical protein
VDQEESKEVTEKEESPREHNVEAAKAEPGNGQSEFDWVTKRSECSLPKVFASLRSQVEKDVKTRNSLRPKFSRYEFSMKDDTGKFFVLLKADEVTKSVTFSLGEHAIAVSGDQNEIVFEVTLAFDDSGKCRLIVNAQECEFWQVRRMALEDLMFRGL